MCFATRLSIESLDPVVFSHIMELALDLPLLDVPGFSGDLGSD